MKLYVDGTLQATNPQTQAQDYTGYWRVGGDSDWGGDSPYLAGSIDEVAVYSHELSASQVAAHFAASPASPNLPPTASFADSENGLTASFDASGSSDPDGSIAAYAWDFGDGGTGNGQSPNHTYGAAGTYSVTLTVTDNEGATDSVTHDVTVSAPPNQAPTASFTHSENGLTAAFDASGSSDPDGTIASYAWDFGDGGTGNGQSPNHTYGAAGAYSVTLTVTDNDGATDSVTHDVTASTAFAADAFTRSVTGGWGSADIGGAWTRNGSATLFGVGNGIGTIKLASAGAGASAYLDSVSARDLDALVDVSTDSAPTGNGVYLSMAVRRSGTSDYRIQVKLSPASVTLYLLRVESGTQTTLASRTISGLTYSGGDVLRVRFDVSGSGTTALSGKVWKASTAEPAGWQVTANDNTADLQNAGGVGLLAYLANNATTVPVATSFDNLAVAAVTGP
ncbi:MAG: PKD domain-containing protein, partial [Mycobacterium sp.]|nr:PKD domain-containing protein [Mycobacterium sp.]